MAREPIVTARLADLHPNSPMITDGWWAVREGDLTYGVFPSRVLHPDVARKMVSVLAEKPLLDPGVHASIFPEESG